MKNSHKLTWRAALGATAVLLSSSAAVAFQRWQVRHRHQVLAEATHAPMGPLDEETLVLRLHAVPDEDDRRARPAREEEDDALLRAIATRAREGRPSAAWLRQRLEIAAQEASRWPGTLPAGGGGLRRTSSVMTGLSWVNLGPTSASFEFNGGVQYPQVDSGRINDIRVDPTNDAIVYVATSGGGVWKSRSFGSADPGWFPLTETLGNLAVGAMDLDPSHPGTLYIGLGDAFDEQGGQVVKSTDGGATWSQPVSLSGKYPNGLAVTATNIRAIRVDPANASLVLVGTDVGLFRSTDAGATFALVDLPNAGTAKLAESVWSIAFTGSVGGVSRWAISGVYAKDAATAPPEAGLGTSSNPGDIWVTTDAAVTFSSGLAAGTLPSTAVGRCTLGAGTPTTASPPVTTLYAQCAGPSETVGAGLWRSTDSGAHFTDVTGTLTNPTAAVGQPPTADCADTNVGQDQSWYNQAVAVDPGNDNNVVIGGSLCTIRSRNGLSATPTWDLVSHWLPAGGGGLTANGTLPYAHADAHVAIILADPNAASGYRVFFGDDGGLFYSEDVLTASTVNDSTVHWLYPNKGLVTHLAYSVASGDPATGDPVVAFVGLQDNGTRYRDGAQDATVFNQVVGGDGIGTAKVTGGSPATTVYWGSVEYHALYCDPASSGGCNNGNNWNGVDPTFTCTQQNGQPDQLPFFVSYAAVPTQTAAPTVLTMSGKQVFRLRGDPGAGATWQAVSPCVDTYLRGTVVASSSIDGLYGVGSNAGNFWVTADCTGANTACTWKKTATGMGYDVNGDHTITTNEQAVGAQAMAFPPVTPAGKSPGDVFVAGSDYTTARDGNPVSTGLGHLFITNDHGTTWAPLHGDGSGPMLPNVPVWAITYDPADSTNNTLYVGTDLGLYRTVDGGKTWARYGNGLPMVRVTGIALGKAGNFMRVSTFGRGLWEIYPSATAEKGVNGDGDFDRNLQIDYVDLQALALRLGTTPATTTAPFYDWNLDLTGSVNAIDESDLQALLTNFGGTP